MNEPRRKGATQYGYTSTPQGDGNSRTPMIVIGAVVALVVVIGVVALVATSESGESSADAVQEAAGVVVTGTALPEYPADGGLAADPSTDPAVGQTPPTLQGQSFDGSEVTIDPADGTAKVVVFAAHWCPHCQKEIPLIQGFIDDGNVPDGVEVYLVSTSAQANQDNYPPSAWLDQVGWSEQVLLDNADQTAAQAYGLTGFPYMVFVDGDGKVVQRASGEIPLEQFGGFVDEVSVA